MLTQEQKQRVADLSEGLTQYKKQLRRNNKTIDMIEKDNYRISSDMAKLKKELKNIKNKSI